MKKTIFTFFLVINSIISYGQSEIELHIQLLTSDLIGEITLDKEPFFQWVNKVNDEVKSHLKALTGNKEVVILITLHKDAEATISLGARPEIEMEVQQQLLEQISTEKSPRTKITDYSFAIVAKVNEGCDDQKMAYTPELIHPLDRKMAEFEALDLVEKKSALQALIKEEVIPVVTYYETSVDKKFAGVLSIGKMLEQESYNETEIEDLTDRNADYWRATMEMSVGNQLIPFTKACMYIVKGKFDMANRLLFIINIFSDESTLPAAFYEEISIKLDMLNEQLGEEINKGIDLHDKENYKQAIEHYENLLDIFPYSAWLNYELFYSKAAEAKFFEVLKVWDDAKEIVYSCDPMYHMNVNAKSGKEGYLLFRRQEINTLFQSNEKLKPDMISYADIALDLENYGYAAQLYWLILSFYSEEDYNNRNILAYYLYCLDKLGDTESIKNFEGDFKKEFAKIEKNIKKTMEASPVYKAFGTKE